MARTTPTQPFFVYLRASEDHEGENDDDVDERTNTHSRRVSISITCDRPETSFLGWRFAPRTIAAWAAVPQNVRWVGARKNDVRKRKSASVQQTIAYRLLTVRRRLRWLRRSSRTRTHSYRHGRHRWGHCGQRQPNHCSTKQNTNGAHARTQTAETNADFFVLKRTRGPRTHRTFPPFLAGRDSQRRDIKPGTVRPDEIHFSASRDDRTPSQDGRT